MWIFHSIYLILWFCRISETVINTIIGLVSGYPDPDTNNNNNNHIRLCAAALVSEFLGLWGGGWQEGWGWWRGWWWWCQYHPSGRIINVLFKGCLKKYFIFLCPHISYFYAALGCFVYFPWTSFCWEDTRNSKCWCIEAYMITSWNIGEPSSDKLGQAWFEFT